MDILIPVITLGTLGLVFGIGLAVASRRLTVQMDERLEKIMGLLPGSNCGACAKAGCFGLAETLLAGEASADVCRVSEEKVKEEIARLLGQKIEKKAKLTATLHCNGGRRVADKFLYSGLEDCVAANLLLGGAKNCVWGCLGLSTCVQVCPFDAIHMSDERLPVVDEKKCRACNKCVLACPKKLFTLTPSKSRVYVGCSSCDIGKDTRAVCSVGCIACRKCEQVCSFDAIHVFDNLAGIDYVKCNSCGECVKVCPMKTIRIR